MFHEEPFDVAWRFSPRAAPDAREFVFHPYQVTEEQEDGSLIVRFHAGGANFRLWLRVRMGGRVRVRPLSCCKRTFDTRRQLSA